MKQGEHVRYPPLRYYLERVLCDMGGYLALGLETPVDGRQGRKCQGVGIFPNI